MAHHHKSRHKGDLARLTALAGAALAVFAAVLLAIIAYSGWSANQSAFEREQKLVDNALNESIERTLNEQKSVAWWDDAVSRITDQAIDLDFADSNFGVFLTETYGQDEVYILNSKNEPIYGFADSARISPTMFERRRAALMPIISELQLHTAPLLRVRPDMFGEGQKNYRVLVGAADMARWAGHVISVDGRPAVVTGITIVPNFNMHILKGPPCILIGVTYVDDAFISSLGRSLLLNDLRLTHTAPHRDGVASEPFITDDGVNVGQLSWTTKRPGQILLTVILPLVGVALGAAGIVFANMLLRLKRASAELAHSEVQARHESLHDSLSGLPNRQHFLLQLEKLLAAASGPNGPRQKVVAAYIDVDRFKDINDTMGHHAGDILIRAVAGRLSTHARSGDFLARFGGDEFAILCLTSPRVDATLIARRVAQAFAAPFMIDGQSIRVTASIGLAVAPDHGEGADELMRHADIALYEAKNQGRDCAVMFALSMGDKVAHRRAIEVDLRAAIEANGLDMHFQPIISAQSGKIVGAEALVRWNHPKHGAMEPGAFIPVAEEAGLMPALGDWILRRAFKTSKRWPNLEIAVNLSPVQFRHTDLQGQLHRLASEYSVDPRNIVLEITEGVLLESDQRTKAMLESLRATGFKLALDDFGTGYSSLAYLCEFKFDKIKIDRTFVAGFARGDVPRTVLSAVVALGQGLGMSVVAEGVETEFDALAMRHLGCTEMQGHYFSEAVEARALDLLIAKDAVTQPPIPQQAAQS